MSGSFMSDKGTQTSEDWQVERVEIKPEKKKKKHRRSASFGHADTKLALNCIRQKLQKTKDQGTKQRSSPIPANHNALLQTAPAVLMRSSAITINIPKASVPRHQRNSVEGLNPEIERLVQMTISGPEEEIERTTTDIPDGHRAPVPQIYSGMRSIDTQTPSSPCGGSNSSARVSSREGRSSSSPASPNRPHSFSPTIPIILGHLENSPRPSSCYDSPIGSTHGNKSDKEGDSDSISPADMYLKKTSSPKPNKILVREPPDGCEKVKFYDEDKSGWQPSIKEPLLFCPIEGQGKFELKPSLSSAFCPLKKLYNHTQGTANYTQTNSLTSVTSSIEGH